MAKFNIEVELDWMDEEAYSIDDELRERIVKGVENALLEKATNEAVKAVDNKIAEKILEATKETAQTKFETSVSCIGASICQVGARDSQALLQACVKAVGEAQIPDGALPQIHISGCPSSCGTHQTGPMGFRGGVRMADGKAQPAFVFYLGGNEVQGKETMGRELGTMFESEIPSFLVKLGKEIAARLDFESYRTQYPDGIEKAAAEYLA
mgnify:FL=1